VASTSAFFLKTNRAWVLVCAALALLIALAVWCASEKAMKMEAAAAVPGHAHFESLEPGDATKIVLEVVDSSPPKTIKGRLLEERTETVYTRTGTLAEAAFDTSTSFVIGKVVDIHAGAVLHITGTVTASHAIQRQIVVLTRYVQVR
jgi:hypothetical protein